MTVEFYQLDIKPLGSGSLIVLFWNFGLFCVLLAGMLAQFCPPTLFFFLNVPAILFLIPKSSFIIVF